MSEKIKRFIECLLPVTACNIKCSYCYVVQRNNRKMQMSTLKYSPEIIGKALNKERWGGICYFSICGAGETLLPKESIDIVYQILKQGHFVNITTNGTITKRFDEIVRFPEEFLQRLHFSFSFHYLELVRINKVEEFFNNINKVKKAGCSFMVQINLCDEYIPYLDEIKSLCIKNVGAMPQVAATRKENNLMSNVELMTELSVEEYTRLGKSFNSPLFDFTMKNFNVHQKAFCYAGEWGGILNLETGIFSRCYASNIRQDIFKDVNSVIDFQAIGNHCNSLFCMNSSHFLSLGMCPDIETPSYAELRNSSHAGWYTKRMEQFLGSKLCENNDLYDEIQLERTERFARIERRKIAINRARNIIKRLVRR